MVLKKKKAAATIFDNNAVIHILSWIPLTIGLIIIYLIIFLRKKFVHSNKIIKKNGRKIKKRVLKFLFAKRWKKRLKTKISHTLLTLKNAFLLLFLPFKQLKKLRSSLVISFIIISLLCFISFQIVSFVRELPDPHTLKNKPVPMTTKITDRNGTLLYSMFVDQDRTLVPLDKIPATVKQATIAIEDHDFYSHIGFSIRGMLRAAKETLLHHRIQGGSTLTQQLIKNTLLSPEPTVSRKIKELVLSFWTERIYTKDEILEMYLNLVPYGGTYWGIESASHGFFGKSASNLTLSEAAFLAGLPAAPTEYSPFFGNRSAALQRQKSVLDQMVNMGFITMQEAQTAEKEHLTLVPQQTPLQAPHFVMFVKKLLAEKYGLRKVEQGGLYVKTSLDLDKQKMAEQIVQNEVNQLATLRVGNGAAVITNPKNGDILAMVGSKDYWDITGQGNVNITTSLRQPGSTIKVVTYAAALQSGFTASSLLDDSPITYTFNGEAPYSPVNYDGAFHGRIPLRYALANSYNVPAVKVLDRIGVSRMVQYGKKMGIKSWDDSSRFGLSLTLGAGEVTLLDMSTVFGTLANKGARVDLNPILEVRDFDGKILEEKKDVASTQVVPEGIAYILSSILSDNQARSWAFGPNSTLQIPNRTVAVKTGTSNEKRDNLAIGYTPSNVVAVWVGNMDNSPMDPVLTSGITGASPIWQKIMMNLTKDKDEPFEKPESVVVVQCYSGKSEFYLKGTEGSRICPTSTPAHFAQSGQNPVN